MTNTYARCRGGWILAEIMASIVIVSAIIAVITTAESNATQMNKLQLARQQCIAAAEAQLDALTATGKALDANTNKQLWPNVTVEFRRRGGEGAWGGLTLVTAVATAPAGAVTARIELSRYITEGDREISDAGVSPASSEGILPSQNNAFAAETAAVRAGDAVAEGGQP